VSANPYQWPDGKRGAVSLSFDDARPSQIEDGVPTLNKAGARATFYVLPQAVERRLNEWKAVLTAGHEIGCHTLNHPCSKNFTWVRDHANEDYTLERMEGELTGANQRIHELLGVTPSTFAFPCGLTYVGRGEKTQSYVPLVAKHFLAGRGFRNEFLNSPHYCDFAQLAGIDGDMKSAEYLISMAKRAIDECGWVIMVFHDSRPNDARQTVRTDVLNEVCKFCLEPANGLWLDTIANIAGYIKAHRK
jgi:peptidoglycan/xylan/chitin deacetylase (PgdA/CDA1 family)